MNWSDMSLREREALVAEKVMDIEVFRYSSEPIVVENNWVGPPKRYTTDISAAWEVVEKMRASGVLFEIGSRVSGDWYAMTMPPDFLSCPECDAPYDWPYSHAPTAPEAICLAALRAVGAVDG